MYAKLRVAKGEIKTIRCLLDTGADETCINKKFVKKFKKVKTAPTVWSTTAGRLMTKYKVKAYFSLTEFYEKKIIEWNCHAFDNTCQYDAIIGRDLLSELGIKFDFKFGNIEWNNATIPMKLVDCTVQDMYVQDADSIKSETDRVKSILDAKYEPADLDQIVGEYSHLSKLEQSQLLKLLKSTVYYLMVH